MHGHAIGGVADGEVVDADRAHLSRCQIGGGIGGEADEPFVEGSREPGLPGVAGAYQHAFTSLQVMCGEFLDRDRLVVRDLDHTSGAHGVGRLPVAHRASAAHEVPHGIHVRAGVRGQGELGGLENMPVIVAAEVRDREQRIAGPGGKSGAERHGNVPPVAGECVDRMGVVAHAV